MTNNLPAPIMMPIKEMEAVAKYVVNSGFWPAYTKLDQVIPLMMKAQSKGMHIIDAMDMFDVIQGKVTMKADAMLAEFNRRGGKWQWNKSDDQVASASAVHWNGVKTVVQYTIEDARKEGLANRGSWVKMPKIMLRKRCVSNGLRMVAPEIVLGIYTPEEITDNDMGNKKPEKKEKERKAGFDKSKEVDATVVVDPPTPPAEDENQALTESDPFEDTSQEPKQTEPQMCTEKEWKGAKSYAKQQGVNKDIFMGLCSALLIDVSAKTIPQDKRQMFLDKVVEWKEGQDGKKKGKK